MLSFVENFTFYSIFLTYDHAVTQENIRGAVLSSIVIFSAFFFMLEIRGAVYMRETIKNILDSEATKL